MSFGFGNNSTTFGGFGSSSNTGGGGFGANNNNASTGGSLFGGNTATSGGGGGFGGFGATNNTTSPFGANKPATGAFGAPATTSSGGGLFGSNTSTTGAFGSGGGGFGSTNTNNASSGFGGGNTGGGLFGASKPATGGFGSTGNTGGSLFGGGNTSGGFGSNTNTTPNNPFSMNSGAAASGTGFGASNNTTAGAGFGGFGASPSAASNNNQGTAAVPFNAISEKDAASNTMVAYQSITFQDPYKNKSFEELRVEDYAQGRRYGNTNGQAGAFGQSTGFGGFGQTQNTGTTGGGLFGNQNNTNNAATGGSTFGGFGNTNNNTSSGGAFGGNTGAGLFGAQNKPAGGSLFGNTASSAAPATGFGTTAGSGGGLFGSNNNTQQQSNPFGGSSNTGTSLFGNQNNQQPQNNAFGASANSGGGLFGNQQNQQQNKPAFGGFGSSTTNTGGAFGSNAGTGGSLFGNNNNQQQQQQQPQQQNSLFGGSNTNSGGGLFGNQNKPATGGGLFGSNTNTNTGGGLFGNNNQQTGSTGGGLFGSTNTQNNTGGGLFGNQNQNKPATGGGLFGSSTTNNNTGGGLFGNSQNTGGSSLFGGNNQNKPAGGSLFGNTGNTGGSSLFGNTNTNNQNTGGSLFGNSGNAGGSLFGGNNQNQQPQNNSLFGSTNNQQQQPNQLHATLTNAPYGNEQLFASLAAPSPPVGPLATPLNGAKPAPKKTPSLMASMRLNTPVYSPRASGSLGKSTGYGFSYSTYGTPGSAFSGSLTPGASSMLRPTGSFSSALTRKLGKSVSMGNLRGDGTPIERPSLLRESALSPPGSRYGSGSVRKLNIDKSLRTELFSPTRSGAEETPKRGVSFNETADRSQARDARPSMDNALVRTETEETEQEDSPPLLRSRPQANATRQPEMTQVSGANGALTTVPEDNTVSQRPASAPSTQQKSASTNNLRKGELGEYFTEPSIRDLKNMARGQLSKMGKFVVGREGVGRIEFGPCDLSNVELDNICGDIVQLITRSATVYKDDAGKPMRGRGLNVPSTIHLENSWPRSHGGKKAVHAAEGRELDKHITRLKRVGGTKFEKYDPRTGVWTFKVDHFTTYGLDDDDDEEEYTEDIGESSALSEPPETPGQGREEEDDTDQSGETEPQDDTFQFKLTRRSQMSIPGGFDEPSVSYDYDDPSADEGMEDDNEPNDAGLEDPFTASRGLVRAPSPDAIEQNHSSMADNETGDVDMSDEELESPEMPGTFAPEARIPKSILKPTMALMSPEKLATESWEDQLQRTISPRKRDRQALKDMQQSIMRTMEQDGTFESPLKQSMFGRSMLGQSALGESYLATKSAKKSKLAGPDFGKSQAFRNSMDIMNSLWADEKSGKKAAAGAKGFEYPYPKRARLDNPSSLEENDVIFHNNIKPSFAADGTFVYGQSGSAPQVSGDLAPFMEPLVGERKDVRFAKYVPASDLSTATLQAQTEITEIETKANSMPSAHLKVSNVLFRGAAGAMASDVGTKLPATLEKQEMAIWQLLSILFDPVEASCRGFVKHIPAGLTEQFEDRIKMDAFSDLWAGLAGPSADEGLRSAKTAEEKALLLLTKNDVVGACETLMAANDFRLATLVSQLSASPTANRDVIQKQIDAWQRRKDWSEMSDAVRALYSILAGKLCVVPGSGSGRIAAEDKVDEFCIADRFGLSWQQSIGLRIFFGGHTTLANAINAYCNDLDSTDSKEVFPASIWYVETGEKKFEDLQDTLLQLCRLYAGGTEFNALFDALTISGNAMHTRLAWQLATLLNAKKLTALSNEKLEKLTVDFASELEAAGMLVDSARVLLHLQDDDARSSAITALLNRNAGHISEFSTRDGEKCSTLLTDDLQLPTSVVCAAQALHAKATGDALSQARWLIAAGNLDEAHEVLCSTVGPEAVIEQDNDSLAFLIENFQSSDRPAGWEYGGQVYESFVRLSRMSAQQKDSNDGDDLLKALRKGLDGMEAGDRKKKALEQKVAAREMRKVLEQWERESEDVEDQTASDDVSVKGSGQGVVFLEKYRRAMGVV